MTLSIVLTDEIMELNPDLYNEGVGTGDTIEVEWERPKNPPHNG